LSAPAWLLRGGWEALIKFVASLTIADDLASASAGDPRTSTLLAELLGDGGITLGK
jgi:hypothetical protein